MFTVRKVALWVYLLVVMLLLSIIAQAAVRDQPGWASFVVYAIMGAGSVSAAYFALDDDDDR